MAQSHHFEHGPDWLIGSEPLQAPDEPRLERDPHADAELRATYPITVDDLRSPVDVQGSTEHRIAAYVLDPTMHVGP